MRKHVGNIGHQEQKNRTVQLERTFSDQTQLPYQFRANQKLKHIKDIIPLPLEHWQIWAINRLSRTLVPVFDHPHGQEIIREFMQGGM